MRQNKPFAAAQPTAWFDPKQSSAKRGGSDGISALPESLSDEGWRVVRELPLFISRSRHDKRRKPGKEPAHDISITEVAPPSLDVGSIQHTSSLCSC